MDALNPGSAAPESRTGRWLLWLAAGATGLLGLIVTFGVPSRWLGGLVLPDDVLLVRELMVAVVVLPLAAVAARRQHIMVTLFTDRLPAPRRRAIERFAGAATLVFFSLLLWAGARDLIHAVATGEYYDGDLRWPAAVGHALYVLGLGSCCLYLLVHRPRPDVAGGPDAGP